VSLLQKNLFLFIIALARAKKFFWQTYRIITIHPLT